MSVFNRFTALRWIYNVIVPPRYRDKLAITEELCALERTLNKVIDVTNANGQALEAITKDLEDIQLGTGGYYTPVFEQNGNTVEVSFVASNTMLPAVGVYSLTLPVGPSGKSAYEVAVDNGFKGSVEDFFASLKGDPYTLTESDKNSIVQSVVEALGGQPVAGYFDKDNNIIITSALADGTYTIKLEKVDGTYNLGTVTVKTTANKYTVTFVADGVTVKVVEYDEGATSLGPNDVPDVPAKNGYTGVWESYTLNNTNITVNAVYTAIEPTYENLADPGSADWKEGYRLSISSGSVSALAGHTTTNFIPCAMGNTLRIKGMKITGSVGGTTDGSDYAKIVMYNSEKTKIGGLYGHGSVAEQMYTAKVTTNGDWSVYTILLDNNDKQWATDQLRYIRIDGKLTGAASDVVINIIPA